MGKICHLSVLEKKVVYLIPRLKGYIQFAPTLNVMFTIPHKK